MDYAEFVNRLTSHDKIVVGKKKEIPCDLVIGILMKGNKTLLPLYYISSEIYTQQKDYQAFYDYIWALINKREIIIGKRKEIAVHEVTLEY